MMHHVEPGIVLMAGELDPKMNTIDAHLLTNQMQIYYLGDEETFDVVRKFNFRYASQLHVYRRLLCV